MNWEAATFEVRKARTDPYLSAEVAAVAIVAAALGDKVLWSVDLGAADAGRTITPLYRDAYRAYRLLLGMGVLVQVWPKGDNE